MYGDVDIVVSDGFTGNIAMKAVEGCGKSVSYALNKEFKKNIFTKLRAALCMDILKKIKGSLDYEAKGGAIFLGLNKAVVKGHGNSKARGFAVCIEQAYNAAKGDLVGKIKEMIDKTAAEEAPTAEE